MSAQYDQLFQEVGKEYGIDPMLLKGIASVESNFNPKAVGPKTRSGQAQGMMQFIPAMQKPYGIEDPFDPKQSVTGAARMMSDLLKRYKGDVGKALEAYNGGPRLVGKSTQTRQYAEKVQRKAQLFTKNTPKPSIEVAGTPSQGPSALSRTQEAAQATPKFNVGPKTVAQGPSLEGMGEDYKAALALSYLTEDDSDGLTVTERAEQMLADQEEASSIRGDALSQIFTMPGEEEGEVDPFSVYAAVQNPQPQVQPQQFADGGFVLGGTSLPGMPNPMLDPVRYMTPEVKRIMESIEPLNKKYEEEAAAYNRGVEEYNKAYNAWLEKATAYNAAVQGVQQKEDLYNKYATFYNDVILPAYERSAAKNPAANYVAPDFTEWATSTIAGAPILSTNYESWAPKFQEEFGWGYTKERDQVPDRALFPTGTPEDWMKSLPAKPAEWKGTFTGVEPKLGYDPKEYEEKLAPLRAAQERAQTVGKQQQLALEVVANPDAYNLAGFGMKDGGEVSAMDRVREFFKAMDLTPLDALYAAGRTGAGAAIGLMPSDLNANEDELLARYRAMAERERTTPQPPMAGRAEGSPPYGEDVDMQMFGDTGDRSMAEAKKGFGRSVDAIRRGVQYSPADLLGAPVDVINMALEPFGLGSEKPFLGSEYLIDKGVQAGIYEPPTGEGEETAARFAAGMINPTLGPRAVGRIAEGIETLGRTPPKGAVTLQDAAADRQLHENPLTRSAEKPFIGELESLLMGLGKEEVTPAEVTQLVSQYKASLGSKMERRKRRVLEERIDEIFMGKDPNTPISIEQLFGDLERTSPKRLSQEILGPEYFQTNPDSVIELHEKVDNPYTTKPLGVTTITFDTPKNANDLSGRLYDMEKAAYSLRDVFVGIGGEGQMNKLFGLQRYLTDLENVAPSSPEVAKLRAAIEDASEELPKLGKAAKHLHTALQARPTSAELDAVQYGIMKDYPDLFDLANRRAIYGEDGGENLLYQLKVGRATHAKMAKGLSDFEKELIDQGKMTDKLRDEIELAKFKLGKSGSSSVAEFDNSAFDLASEDPDKAFQSLRAQGVYDVARKFGTGIGDEPTRAVVNAADDVVATLQKSLPFGMDLNDSVHVMNTKGRNVQQLGFTRFVEFDPGETIQVDDWVKLKAYDFPASKKGALFATELQSDMRAADREIEQPFNLKNQEALRDLLIKNLVDTAVKRGRDLVLMPGADSKQAQLYEFIDRYVEATVKDLGPNFKAVKVPTVNSSGQYVIRPGIYITPEGEKEILEKGLKFAKGGMVDKPLYDRAA
jgi:hypothetical protein